MEQCNENQVKDWNDFILRKGGSFLQSFEWGEFQKSLGRKIWRFKDDNFLALIIKCDLPFSKSYLYCPRGPIITNNAQHATNNFLKEVKKVTEKEKAIFLRVDPEWGIGSENILEKLGFKKSFKEIQPKKTLILGLMKLEDELLARMHPKTRYNIRLAQRHNIKIQHLTPHQSLRHGTGQASNIQYPFEDFWKLLQQTAKRDKFRPHSKEHYQKLLEFIPGAKLFLAEYKDKIIAANIVVFFGQRATYLHGASNFEHRNLMAPHFLQWQQILEAKKRGLSEYDFWGIDERKWPGITRFKKGFGGKEVNYIGAWDLVFEKKRYAACKVGTHLFKILKAA